MISDLTDEQLVDLACARLTDAAAGDIHADWAEDLLDAADDLRNDADGSALRILRALLDDSTVNPVHTCSCEEDLDDTADVDGDLAYES